MTFSLACTCLLTLLAPAGAPPPSSAGLGPVQEGSDDVVPSIERTIDDDEKMRYFEIGIEEGEKPPKKGYRLLLVLPGGKGDEGFLNFVRLIAKNSLGDDYLVAQLVRPFWNERQARTNVWPTKKNPATGMKFSVEEFIGAVIEDVEERHPIDKRYIFTLSWSSGGPAAYAYSVTKGARVTGSFISQSAFLPQFMPSLKGAKGHAYYLYQSPEDEKTTFDQAERAKEKLEKAKAVVKLVSYEGGHGWHGNVYGDIRTGIEWLENKHAKPRR